MWSLLGVALLVGMHHALEADHVAAVSSLATGKKRLPDVVSQGLTWGLGHTAALFLFAGVALLLGHAIPEHFATHLESAVGIMLIGLGLHVIWRLWKDRIHFHGHAHTQGQYHFHAHSHAAESLPHTMSRHRHRHEFAWRTLFVGMTHGMAGSAALLLFTVAQTYSTAQGIGFILLFGVGSMAGMAVVSVAIGLPLLLTARFLTWANRALQLCVGLVTAGIGASIVYHTVLAS